MKRKFLKVATICAIIGSMTLSSCIGSFSLTNRLLSWNDTIGNKFVNELVFIAFWVLPVYEVSGLADILVINSIEFWSGSSPLAQGSTIIDGNDGKYLVDRDSSGYTITSLNDNASIRLNYDEAQRTWSVVGASGTEYPIMTFVDDNHLKMNSGNGEMILIEKSQEGLYAYRQAVAENTTYFASR